MLTRGCDFAGYPSNSGKAALVQTRQLADGVDAAGDHARPRIQPHAARGWRNSEPRLDDATVTRLRGPADPAAAAAITLTAPPGCAPDQLETLRCCDVSDGEAGLSVRTGGVIYRLPARAAGPVRAAVLDRAGTGDVTANREPLFTGATGALGWSLDRLGTAVAALTGQLTGAGTRIDADPVPAGTPIRGLRAVTVTSPATSVSRYTGSAAPGRPWTPSRPKSSTSSPALHAPSPSATGTSTPRSSSPATARDHPPSSPRRLPRTHR